MRIIANWSSSWRLMDIALWDGVKAAQEGGCHISEKVTRKGWTERRVVSLRTKSRSLRILVSSGVVMVQQQQYGICSVISTWFIFIVPVFPFLLIILLTYGTHSRSNYTTLLLNYKPRTLVIGLVLITKVQLLIVNSGTYVCRTIKRGSRNQILVRYVGSYHLGIRYGMLQLSGTSIFSDTLACGNGTSDTFNYGSHGQII